MRAFLILLIHSLRTFVRAVERLNVFGDARRVYPNNQARLRERLLIETK